MRYPIKHAQLILILILLITPHHLSSRNHIAITAVGDIYISNRTIKTLHKNLYFKGDIVFGNFEGVLSKNPVENERLKLTLTMPYLVPDALKAMGFNTLSLANNHSFDLGKDGYNKTARFLKDKNITVCGFNTNGNIKTIKRKQVRIIGFTFTGKNNVNNILNTIKTIKSLSEDIIIVSAHMGHERGGPIPLGRIEYFHNQKRGNVQQFSRACIDAGADLIIGHGPHFLRGLELYKNRLVIYSLGNFLFDYPGVKNNRPIPTCAIQVNINSTGAFISGEIHSFIFDKGVVTRDQKNKAFYIMKNLSLQTDKDKSLKFESGYVYARYKKQAKSLVWKFKDLEPTGKDNIKINIAHDYDSYYIYDDSLKNRNIYEINKNYYHDSYISKIMLFRRLLKKPKFSGSL